MGTLRQFFKCAVAVFLLAVGGGHACAAQEVDVEALLAELANPETRNWQTVERRISKEWSRSGSASMDLLLQRGEKAMEAEDYEAALEHLTALTDHAPDFAAGWNARATALFHQELWGPAMQDLARALALNPRHFEALTGLAVILGQTGKEDEALQVWHMVRALHPHRPEMNEAIEALEKRVGGEAL